MPWKWLAASLATVCVAAGSPAVFSQQPRCDSTSTVHGACVCGECKEGVGVRIPSLQFLFVDKLSAAGDRLEGACKVSSATCDSIPRIPRTKQGIRKLQDKLSASRHIAEPSCGVEPTCGLDGVFAARLPAVVRKNRAVASSGIRSAHCANGRCPLPAASGNISDATPSPSVEPKKTETVAETAESTLPASLPVSLPNSVPSKLLPTPVSDLLQLPVVPKVEPPQSPVPPTPVAEESGPLPRIESLPPTPPKQEALPDILVDPFLEDVSKARPIAPKGIALSGWRSSTQVSDLKDPKHLKAAPFNSLRDDNLLRDDNSQRDAANESEADLPRIRVSEPKRLTLNQKQATAVQVPPQSKRIDVMQSLAEQGGK